MASDDYVTGKGQDLECGDENFLKNLVWIQDNRYPREALAEWERRFKVDNQSARQRENRCQDLTNQVYNLVGFFSVFQGVVLTAVTQLTGSTQPPRPLCGKVWFPVLLSGLAAIATSVGICLKFKDLYEQKLFLQRDKLACRNSLTKAQRLRSEGIKFPGSDAQEATGKTQEEAAIRAESILKAVVVIGGVLIFTVIFVLSYFSILCDKWVIPGWSSYIFKCVVVGLEWQLLNNTQGCVNNDQGWT